MPNIESNKTAATEYLEKKEFSLAALSLLDGPSLLYPSQEENLVIKSEIVKVRLSNSGLLMANPQMDTLRPTVVKYWSGHVFPIAS